ncbi:hypothetical protein Ancab_004029 [Ancistrocladus abbreviatus]
MLNASWLPLSSFPVQVFLSLLTHRYQQYSLVSATILLQHRFGEKDLRPPTRQFRFTLTAYILFKDVVAIKAVVLPIAKCSIVLRSDYYLRWNTPMYFTVKEAPDMHFLANQDYSSGCQANDRGLKPVHGTYILLLSVFKAISMACYTIQNQPIDIHPSILKMFAYGNNHFVMAIIQPLLLHAIRPFCVEGWDQALHEIGKLSFETIISPPDAVSLWKVMEHLPVLVVAGAEDALVSLNSSEVMASKLMNSRVVATSGCSHLPHEVCPMALLAVMHPCICRTLSEPHLPER